VDSTSTTILLDFERPIDGWESPWGRVQFAMIYDEARTPEPPRTVEELGAWIRANPGRFTHDQSFTGVTFLKALMYALSGGHEPFAGGFDEAAFAEGERTRLWSWLAEHTPHFWRGGAAYPAGVAELHRLFANREVDFSFSNNENEVVTKVRQGILPSTARATVLRDARSPMPTTWASPSMPGIPPGPWWWRTSSSRPRPSSGRRTRTSGATDRSSTMDRLEPRWQDAFEALEVDPRAIPRDTLDRYARPEVAPEYHERILEEWRRRIRRGS
jgi:putative spermidine/putrescine transport system substrate-binding protein